MNKKKRLEKKTTSGESESAKSEEEGRKKRTERNGVLLSSFLLFFFQKSRLTFGGVELPVCIAEAETANSTRRTALRHYANLESGIRCSRHVCVFISMTTLCRPFSLTGFGRGNNK